MPPNTSHALFCLVQQSTPFPLSIYPFQFLYPLLASISYLLTIIVLSGVLSQFLGLLLGKGPAAVAKQNQKNDSSPVIICWLLPSISLLPCSTEESTAVPNWERRRRGLLDDDVKTQGYK